MRVRRALGAAQVASEPAQVGGVGAGDGRQQQLVHGRPVERVRLGRSPQHREQRRDGRFRGQRQLVGRHLERHAGGRQRAAQRWDGQPTAAYDDGHLVPRQALFEVGPPQQVGDVG